MERLGGIIYDILEVSINLAKNPAVVRLAALVEATASKVRPTWRRAGRRDALVQSWQTGEGQGTVGLSWQQRLDLCIHKAYWNLNGWRFSAMGCARALESGRTTPSVVHATPGGRTAVSVVPARPADSPVTTDQSGCHCHVTVDYPAMRKRIGWLRGPSSIPQKDMPVDIRSLSRDIDRKPGAAAGPNISLDESWGSDTLLFSTTTG